MLNRPDKSALLLAIARFLEIDVAPSVRERGLLFRIKIARHLLQQLAGQVSAEERLLEAELASLCALLDAPVPEGATPDAIAQLNDQLLTRLDGAVGLEPVFAHLKAVLRAEMAITNPRFRTDPNIEESPS